MVSLTKYPIVRYSPFHLKEELYGFSLAYLTCQHHYSYALGPLYKPCYATSVSLITEMATK